MHFLFLLSPIGHATLFSGPRLTPGPQVHCPITYQARKPSRMKMEIEEPIGGRSEGGTHLTGLQDVLVSLQKQDPPICLCFEVLGSLTSLLSVCACVGGGGECAHVRMCARAGVTECLCARVSRILPVWGKWGDGRTGNALRLPPLLLSIRQGWVAASRQVGQATVPVFAPG